MNEPSRFRPKYSIKRGASLFPVILAVVCLTAPVALAAETGKDPVRAVTDPGVIPTRQSITPAGVQSVFNGSVHGAHFGRGGDIWVLTADGLYQLDWLENHVVRRQTLGGVSGVRSLVVDPKSGEPIVVYTAADGHDSPKAQVGVGAHVQAFVAAGSTMTKIGGDLGVDGAGEPGLWRGELLVPLTAEDRIDAVNLSTGAGRKLGVGIAPIALVTDGDTAFVANWGGEPAEKGAPSATTGLDPSSDRVRIDAHGVAGPGTVTVVDLATFKAEATIAVGRHPTALAIDPQAHRLYVANTNDDTLSVIDTVSRAVVQTITLQPFDRKVEGVAPTALAIDIQRHRLYIACGGINAIAVYDLDAQRIAGLIPTGWYPISVELSSGGGQLLVGALLGVGSGSEDDPTRRYAPAKRGTVHVISVPDEAQLANDTLAVEDNNHMAPSRSGPSPINLQAVAKAVPVRAGEPSLIDHVVFIIRENRTYDQILGDLERGNGKPQFELYGEDVTPNTHRLARQFVTLDNFYATGGNSGDGHQWLTQANETSYTLWPGYSGRSYPFDGTDPLAYSAGGFIWDAALAAHKSVAVFGEYAPRLGWDQAGRADLLHRWEAHAPVPRRWSTHSPIPPLDGILVRDYPGWALGVPDVVRAEIFGRKLQAYVRAKAMPNLTIIQLPSDHTSGTTPGLMTPKAMVADNDYALGQIVEALSHSPFWPKMAIFVVEDDAQDGVDHVDGHRTVALAISPYSRRGSVDSTFYAHPSLLKTIELMLGLPTLSLFDLTANDMRGSFQDQADLSPYAAIRPTYDLFAVNPPALALKGQAKRDALRSAAMLWDRPDAAPSDILNRILWRNVKGPGAAYPAGSGSAFRPASQDKASTKGGLDGDD
jgi:YVTN family beta-propeller protein